MLCTQASALLVVIRLGPNPRPCKAHQHFKEAIDYAMYGTTIEEREQPRKKIAGHNKQSTHMATVQGVKADEFVDEGTCSFPRTHKFQCSSSGWTHNPNTYKTYQHFDEILGYEDLCQTTEAHEQFRKKMVLMTMRREPTVQCVKGE